MLARDQIEALLSSTESFRIERTISTTDTDKFCEAICAFANDMPDSRQNGYLLIGVDDDGKRAGIKATDKLLKDLSSIRSDGNVLPTPVMNVSSISFDDGDVVVVEVEPSCFPPVRFYQYSDRLEIENPGGLYGKVTPENFPEASDYRNPVIALAMRVMGYVNKFGRGISRVQHDLAENGNPPAVFSTELITIFRAKVPAATDAGLAFFSTIQEAKSVLTKAISTLSDKKRAHIVRVFDLLCENDKITISALSDALSLSRTAIVKDIEYLKSLGILTREGGTRGHWRFLAPAHHSKL